MQAYLLGVAGGALLGLALGLSPTAVLIGAAGATVVGLILYRKRG
jgi:hypothetical protein